MSSPCKSEAERLRRCRLIFERSLADRVPMETAKARVEADARRAAAEARRLDRQPAVGRWRDADPDAPTRKPFWREGQYA